MAKRARQLGRSVNAILASLVERSSQKSFCSLRTTFISKSRQAKVPVEIYKVITGLGSAGRHTKPYYRASIQTLFDNVRKLNLPWLKY